MKKMSVLNRLLLVATGHLAGYMIVRGIEGYDPWTSLYFTIAFGVIVLACLLLILFGYDILNNRMVVVVATLLPLSLSLGLVSVHLPSFHVAYGVFAAAGFVLVVATRIYEAGRFATVALASVHGIAGMVIFLLPIVFSIQGTTPPLFALVGVGGAVIGLAGLLLSFLRMGKPILSKERIYSALPALLLVMTALFVFGMIAE